MPRDYPHPTRGSDTHCRRSEPEVPASLRPRRMRPEQKKQDSGRQWTVHRLACRQTSFSASLPRVKAKGLWPAKAACGGEVSGWRPSKFCHQPYSGPRRLTSAFEIAIVAEPARLRLAGVVQLGASPPGAAGGVVAVTGACGGAIPPGGHRPCCMPRPGMFQPLLRVHHVAVWVDVRRGERHGVSAVRRGKTMAGDGRSSKLGVRSCATQGQRLEFGKRTTRPTPY